MASGMGKRINLLEILHIKWNNNAHCSSESTSCPKHYGRLQYIQPQRYTTQQ